MSGRTAAVLALALGLLAAAPAPAPSASPLGATVICEATPMYLWPSDTNRPSRGSTPSARLGERFTVLSGPRSTLGGFSLVETDAPATEIGSGAHEHYWLNRDCVTLSR